MDKDTTDRLKRIESALYAIAASQDKLVHLLTEEAEEVDAQETDLEGNTTDAAERDQTKPLS